MQAHEIREDQLFRTIAVRLKAGRRNNRLKQPEVAAAIGQKGLTQISLWESGERQPKLIDLVRLSKMYGFTLDWICGLSDDAIADTQENNQGFMVNLIASSINRHHAEWVATVSGAVAVALSSLNADRVSIRDISAQLTELSAAYRRMKELNPTFDEEIRNAAKVELVLGALTRTVTEANDRIESEIRQCAAIDSEVKMAGVEYERDKAKTLSQSVSQMMLDISQK